jgi:hypothetical protein
MSQPVHDDIANSQPAETGRDDATWSTAELESAVRERRRQAGMPEEGEAWALALSGGGIRSATFCLGLIRGLAKNRVLRRFDYLSTVSGGGYVGSSLGRMFGQGLSAEEIERGVESERSLWLWWLRSNGRYLTPSGIRDLGQAGVSIVRGALATQLELGILLIMLAAVVILPHVLIASIPWIGRNADSERLPFSAWVLLLPWPLLMGAVRLFGYWLTRRTPVRGGVPMLLSYAALCTLLACVAFDWSNTAVGTIEDVQSQISSLSWYVRIPVGTLLAAGAIAMLLAIRDARRIRADDSEFILRDLRLRYTRGLLFWAMVMFALLAVSFVDWFSWRLATIADSGLGARLVYSVAGLAALGLVLCRALQPVLQEWMNKHPGQHIKVERLLGLVVYGLLVSIAIGWATFVHDIVLPQKLWDSIDNGSKALSLYPLVICGMLLLISGLFVLVTGQNFETVNMASLHGYYRARIERAYVSSGNVSERPGDGARFDRHPTMPIDEYTATVRPPNTVVRGDDVLLSAYAPQTAGGPIHLINCCINQTVDDGSRYFNGDRKGVALTASSLGAIEVGVGAPQQPIENTGFLSKWIAISGAAAGSGMGSHTSPSYSALLFLSGMRLGMWLPCFSPNHHGDLARSPQSRQSAKTSRLPLKVQAIASELLGQFPGLANDTWYVSDGGHFENTGVYPLIKRELPTIVVADCGADPKYLFEDMESMIRKVRIDFGAEIEFISPKEIKEGTASQLMQYLGTPETIGPEPGNACLLLGRIRYRSGARGMLLAVKPRRLEHLPFDAVAYADRHPKYPQQSTGDQFFDEAQWESYQKLGYLIGQTLTPGLLAEARALVDTETPAVSSLIAAQQAREKSTTRSDRLRPVVTASAAGAGIGLSLVLALWQGGGQVMKAWQERIDRRVAVSKAMMENIAAGRLQDVNPYAVVDLRGISADERKSFEQVMFALESCAEPNKTRCEDIKRGVDRVLALKNRDYWNTFHVLQAKERATEVVVIEKPVASASLPAAISTPESVTVTTTASLSASTTEPSAVVALGPTSTSSATTTSVAPPPPPPEPVATASPAIAEPKPTPPPKAPAFSDDDKLKAALVRAEQERRRKALEIETRKQTDVLAKARERLVASTSTACEQKAIYVHIYHESTRRPAQCLLDVIEQELGQRPQGVENVVVAAMRRGSEKASKTWGVPAVLYGESNREQLGACAAGLKTVIGGQTVVRALPSRLRSRPNVVEIWLPPEWRGDAWFASRCGVSEKKAAF